MYSENLDGIYVNRYSCVCSDHFMHTDFETRGKLRILKKTAVPSVFPWTTMPLASSSDSVVPGDLSLQDPFEITFNTTNAVKNYSRSDPPTTFVEEYSTLQIEVPLDDTDSLQISSDDEYTVHSENLSPVPYESGVEIEVIAADITEIQDETITQQEFDLSSNLTSQYCDKSAQTVSTELFSGTDKNFFSVHRYKNTDKAIHFYTGLETFEKLMYVFYTLGDSSNLKYFYKTTPKLDALEQFFIALIILRRHKEFEEIAMLYFISVKEVADIFIAWIRFMTLQWKNLDLWVDKDTVKSYMPLDFYDKYPMTRTVLDATECPIKKPGLPFAQQVTFSSYKNRNTVKFLVGIAPSGLITYISPCYGGSATDRNILERSTILPRFNYNDEIMVD